MNLGTSAPALRMQRMLAARVSQKVASRVRPAPMISFTFDDFPKSAVAAGGRILREFGLRGTYYAALGLMSKTTPVGRIFDRSDLDEVAASGHELACHTFDHPRCCDVTTAEFVMNCESNRTKALEMLDGYVLRNFSFPEGVVTSAAKAALMMCYDTCRTIEPGINVGPIDKAFLLANPVYSSGGIARPMKLVEQSVRENGWLILYTHDVSESPSPYGCTPDEFHHIVKCAVDSGAEILPVAEAAAQFETQV